MSDINLLSHDIVEEELRTLKYKYQKELCASIPLSDKITMALDLIQTHEPPEGYYVAFSGGKDSIVILDLIRKAGVNYDAHYSQTTVDPPELQKFIKQYYSDVEWIKPKKSFFKLIPHKKCIPTRMIRWCCSELKEIGGKNRVIVLGIRWCESRGRRFRTYYHESTKFKDKLFLNPILSFTDEDIWTYIHTNNLNYPSLYDEGYTRLGCILCPLSGQKNKDMDLRRYPKYVKAYLSAIRKMLKVREQKNMPWKHGNEIETLYWWIYEHDASPLELDIFIKLLTELKVIE